MHMSRIFATISCLAILSVNAGAAAELFDGERVDIRGDVHEAEDVSAVVKVGAFLLIAADEKHSVQLLRPNSDRSSYEPDPAVSLMGHDLEDDQELDFEGLAAEGNTLYVLGSHSSKRKRLTSSRKSDRERAYDANRERLAKTAREPSRDVLYRFAVGQDGEIETGSIETTCLRAFLDADPILSVFASLPSKENGIDLEGLAVKDGVLYIGCRGPVLRENWVPVIVTSFDESQHAEIRYVNLGGLGIRGMAETDGGFLLLAGPVGDGPGGYWVYSWNGDDCIPGKDGPKEELDRIGQLETPKGGKAEGITLIDEDDDRWQILVVFDGVKKQKNILFKYALPK